MNILEKILVHKRKELKQAKQQVSPSQLEASLQWQRTPYSLKESLQNEFRSGIISEFKTKSPSKGMIHPLPESMTPKAFVQQVTQGYEAAGASALSVLTDQEFFAGSPEDLLYAREKVQIPILRKDFMIDEYQMLEARAWGADVVLLIAACLSPQELRQLAEFARSLSLEVLLEVHSREELESHLNPFVDIVGVNNRNLKTFEVSLQTSLDLVDDIPSEFVKISESGISQVARILQLKEAGFQGFLIGENFMKTAEPHLSAQAFIQELSQSSKFSQ